MAPCAKSRVKRGSHSISKDDRQPFSHVSSSNGGLRIFHSTVDGGSLSVPSLGGDHGRGQQDRDCPALSLVGTIPIVFWTYEHQRVRILSAINCVIAGAAIAGRRSLSPLLKEIPPPLRIFVWPFVMPITVLVGSLDE